MRAKRMLIGLTLAGLFHGPLSAQDSPPDRAARLAAMAGDVSFQASGLDDWSSATLNLAMTTGDRLFVSRGGHAELDFGGFAVRASEATDVTLSTLSDHVAQVGLAQGTIRISAYDLASDDTIEVDTPHGAITMLSGGACRIDIAPDGSAVLVTVDRGTLDVGGGDSFRHIMADQTVQLTGTDDVRVTIVSASHADAFDEWSADRDRRIASSRSAEYVSRDIPGYRDLDDAGRWEVTPDYGPVWYPAVTVADWAPYRYGRWVWVEPWGWTWVDDAPWGFAPFHYGRWVRIYTSWAWVPGPVVARPVYAPAMVVFVGGVRFGSQPGIQAWFPLGPGEPYRPWYHHNDDYRRRVNATNIRTTATITLTDAEPAHYRYRTAAATTAVAAETFRVGDPIGRRIIRVRADQLAAARPLPHPEVAPTPRAEAAGAPATNPPVAPRPVMVVGRGARRSTDEAPPRSTERPAPQAPPQPAREPEGASAPLITRRPAAPESPPFSARQKALEAHPGRPLEPQQIENLRQGKTAGPARDRESPDHSATPRAAAPRATAPRATAPRNTAPRRDEKKDEQKGAPRRRPDRP